MWSLTAREGFCFTKPNLGPFLLGRLVFPLQNQHHIFFFMGPRFLWAGLSLFYGPICSWHLKSPTPIFVGTPNNWTFHVKKTYGGYLGQVSLMNRLFTHSCRVLIPQSISNTVLVLWETAQLRMGSCGYVSDMSSRRKLFKDSFETSPYSFSMFQ